MNHVPIIALNSIRTTSLASEKTVVVWWKRVK